MNTSGIYNSFRIAVGWGRAGIMGFVCYTGVAIGAPSAFVCYTGFRNRRLSAIYTGVVIGVDTGMPARLHACVPHYRRLSAILVFVIGG